MTTESRTVLSFTATRWTPPLPLPLPSSPCHMLRTYAARFKSHITALPSSDPLTPTAHARLAATHTTGALWARSRVGSPRRAFGLGAFGAFEEVDDLNVALVAEKGVEEDDGRKGQRRTRPSGEPVSSREESESGKAAQLMVRPSIL